MARDFPRTTPSGHLGSCSPGKLRLTSGRLNSRGSVDGRRPFTRCGGVQAKFPSGDLGFSASLSPLLLLGEFGWILNPSGLWFRVWVFFHFLVLCWVSGVLSMNKFLRTTN